MEYQSFLDRRYLKALAKKQLKGNLGTLFLISLIISLVSSAAGWLLDQIPVVGSIASAIIITPAFALSTYRIYLNLTRKFRPLLRDAFSGFDDFWSAFKLNFILLLLFLLWALLFIIPAGIAYFNSISVFFFLPLLLPAFVKCYSYSMAFYILAENKGKPALECIRQSQKMMDGHKAELFFLMLSILPWCLVGLLSLFDMLLLSLAAFVFLSIWVFPYFEAATANFYDNLRPKAAPVCTPEE